MFQTNPITETLHKHQAEQIENAFPELRLKTGDFLLIFPYVGRAPQKFYNDRAYRLYYDFLVCAMRKDPSLLANLFKECEAVLNIGNLTLSEINEKNIHDVFLPTETNELLDFLDKEVHYNLLRLYESSFYSLLFIVASYRRIKLGKGREGLDVYNVMADLKKTEFSFCVDLYENVVRNGIAHGKILYTDQGNIYKDKSGKQETLSPREVIRKFDKVVDVCNGLSLALKVFFAEYSSFVEATDIQVPKSIMIEKLQSKVNAPGWRVINCFDSMNILNQKQLSIHILNEQRTYSESIFYSFLTAFFTEYLTRQYERLFLSMKCKYSKSKAGWAAFNASVLRELREKQVKDIHQYARALEDGFIFFQERYWWPKTIERLRTMWIIFKINFQIGIRSAFEQRFLKPFFIREAQIHCKRKFTVVQDPSIIIKRDFVPSAKIIIRKNRRNIIRAAIKYARKQRSLFSWERVLPVKYIRVFVYDSDKRVRDLRYSGLIPELIATIEVNRSTIRTIDIYNGNVEQIGDYRIVWHTRWRGNTEL